MTPIFTAKFYKEVVELSFGKSAEKTISIQDFTNVFNTHVGHLTPKKEEVETGEIMQVSAGFVGMKSTDGGRNKTVFLYRPEYRANLLFNSARTSVRGLFEDAMGTKLSTEAGKEMAARVNFSVEGTNGVVSNFLVPNFMCAIPLKLNDNKKAYSVGKVKYAITNTPREAVKFTNNAALGNMVNVCGNRPPLPNFYEDGGMCYGSNQVLVTLNNDGNYRPLEFYQNLITASAFSFDIMPYQYPRQFNQDNFLKRLHGVTELSKVPDSVRATLRHNSGLYTFFDYITSLTAPEAKFPYEEFKNEGR